MDQVKPDLFDPPSVEWTLQAKQREEIARLRADAKTLARLCRELQEAYTLHSDHKIAISCEERALLERWEEK